MRGSTAIQTTAERRSSARRLDLKVLVGSGDRIGTFVAPVLIIGIVLNVLWPSFFSVGGPSDTLRILSVAVLIPGVIIWIWSVVLILTKVPKGELITTGPYTLVKHPLYTAVALLVLPWAGFLLDTWLGVVIGIALYAASRTYAPAEEQALSAAFGPEWDEYATSVKIPWL